MNSKSSPFFTAQVDKPKVVIVGPVLPFRGGIAQHTTMLHRAMKDKASVLMLSYSRQYPKWLFPGESDLDPEYDGYCEKDVEYLIDSVNFFSWRRAYRRILDFSPEMIVMPWWHIYWFPMYLYLVLRLRKKKIEVVFICHNVLEHESSFLRNKLSSFLFGKVDRFVVHTKVDKHNLRRSVSSAIVDVYPHPIYDQYPSPSQVLRKRAKLEMLFLGFVRPYKGLNVLIDAMLPLKDKDLLLTVCGEFWSGLEDTVNKIKISDLTDKIDLIPKYQSEEEIANLISRSDVIVLPYISATGSGIIPLAYHYNKPVIATKVGGLPDVIVDHKTGILVEPGSTKDLTDAILYVYNNESWYSLDEIQKLKEAMSWDGFSDAIINRKSIQ